MKWDWLEKAVAACFGVEIVLLILLVLLLAGVKVVNFFGTMIAVTSEGTLSWMLVLVGLTLGTVLCQAILTGMLLGDRDEERQATGTTPFVGMRGTGVGQR